MALVEALPKLYWQFEEGEKKGCSGLLVKCKEQISNIKRKTTILCQLKDSLFCVFMAILLHQSASQEALGDWTVT